MFTKSVQLSFYSIFFISIFMLFFMQAEAATLSLQADDTEIQVGETTTLRMLVDTGGQYINTAKAQIDFSTDVVEVVSIDERRSIFSLWPEKPSFSNTAGIVTFLGGIPSPGYLGPKGSVLTFVVRGKQAGDADFNLFNTDVLANDGLGTSVLYGQQGEALTVTPSIQPVEVSAEDVDRSIAELVSGTHASESNWYSDPNPVFSWNNPQEVTAVQTGLTKDPAGLPYVTYDPPIYKRAISGVGDGVWYFQVRAKRADAWGPVEYYTVRIDTTPPYIEEFDVVYDTTARVLDVEVDASDDDSGVTAYEVSINGVLVKTLDATELASGRYEVPLDAVGANKIAIKVIDKAGNSVIDTIDFDGRSLASPVLYEVPSLVFEGEQFVIEGKTPQPHTDVGVVIVPEHGDSFEIRTMSTFDGSFTLTRSDLAVGEYALYAVVEQDGIVLKSDSSVVSVVAGKRSVVPVDILWNVLVLGLVFALGFCTAYLWFRSRIQEAIQNSKEGKLVTIKKRLEKDLAVVKKMEKIRAIKDKEQKQTKGMESEIKDLEKEIQSLEEE